MCCEHTEHTVRKEGRKEALTSCYFQLLFCCAGKRVLLKDKAIRSCSIRGELREDSFKFLFRVVELLDGLQGW